MSRSVNILSPTQKAINHLYDLLGGDYPVAPDESFHLFHFFTRDYATVKLTINKTCLKKNLPLPVLISIEKLYELISTKEKKNYTSEDCLDSFFGQSKIELDDISQYGEAFFIKNVLEKHIPVFVCINNGNESPSSPKAKIKEEQIRVINSFLKSCSEMRYKHILQTSNIGDASNNKQDINNMLFFFSYGKENILSQFYSSQVQQIRFDDLNCDDFRLIIRELYYRDEYRTREELKKYNKDYKIKELEVDDKTIDWFVNRMSGIEEIEVRRILVSSANQFENGKIDFQNNLKTKKILAKEIIKYKENNLLEHNRLTIVDPGNANGNDVKGLETLNQWLDDHKQCVLSKENAPTGILLVGIPGSGKSMSARITANKFEMPLVQLDMSKILGGRVGDSEKGMREMLQDLEFLSPCILWIDEIEKAMSGAGDNSGDGGTVKRLFGMLLTFISENKKPIFIVTTANDISNLPPEFFRNGRFDQTFCLMMPDYRDCLDITNFHLNKYFGTGNDFKKAEQFFNCCWGDVKNPRFLTGADIEAHVRELAWRTDKSKIRQLFENEQQFKEQMEKITCDSRTQARKSAKQTIDYIAKQYVEMLGRGMTMAGNRKTVFCSNNFHPEKITNYIFDEKDHEIPLCMDLPNLKMEEYDKCFYDTIAHAMTEAIFLDKNTSEFVRNEYYSLLKHLRKQELNAKN